jgi:serine/threonine protein kinase
MKNYINLVKISEGGMGVVYRAEQKSLGRVVAIKRLHRHFLENSEFVKRFYQEAKVAASLNHPNIISIYDYGQDEEGCFIVMEYVEGMNLFDLVKERGCLPAEVAVKICCDIAQALLYTHRRGVIHRDIKPGNILIDNGGRVKLTDFGIAKMLNTEFITSSSSLLGTPAFISPEQIKGEKVAPYSDVFSLGAVLYFSLTEKTPWAGETPYATMNQITTNDYQPIEREYHLRQSLIKIIDKCLQRDCRNRYQTMKELIDDFTEYLKNEGIEEKDEYLTLYLNQPAEYTAYIPDKIVKHHLRKALSAKKEGNWHKAIICLENILERDPENKEALKHLNEIQRLATAKKKNKILKYATVGLGILITGVVVSKIFYLSSVSEKTTEGSVRQSQLTKEEKTLPPLEEKTKLPLVATPEVVKPSPLPNLKRDSFKEATPEKREVTPLKGKLAIHPERWAKVYINSEYKGETPLKLELSAGFYTVELKKEGYQVFKKTVEIKPNKTTLLQPKLEKLNNK